MKKMLFSPILAVLTTGNAAAAPQQATPAKNQAASTPAAAEETKPTDRPVSAPASKTASELADQTASAVGAEVRPSGALNPAAMPQTATIAFTVRDLQSNQMLAVNNPDDLIEPASLTKMMTAYPTFKALEDGTLRADEMLTVSDVGWYTEGPRMFLNPHAPVSVSDLSKGMTVQSNNDAVITLAETIGGIGNDSEQTETPEPPLENSAAMMNMETKRLDINHTRSNDSTGLASERYLSTVSDLAPLAATLIRGYPRYYPIFSLKSLRYNGIEQPNRDLLLFRDSSVNGLKTGYTESAGYNLAASSNRNGRRVITIVVDARSTEVRASENGKLLNRVLQALGTPKPYNAGEMTSQVKVHRSSANVVKIGFADNIYVIILHGPGHRIRPVSETEQPVLTSIKKDSILGKLKVINGKEVLAEKNVTALASVGEDSWLGRTWDSVILWLKSALG